VACPAKLGLPWDKEDKTSENFSLAPEIASCAFCNNPGLSCACFNLSTVLNIFEITAFGLIQATEIFFEAVIARLYGEPLF
jgi:hypothetical protein